MRSSRVDRQAYRMSAAARTAAVFALTSSIMAIAGVMFAGGVVVVCAVSLVDRLGRLRSDVQ